MNDFNNVKDFWTKKKKKKLYNNPKQIHTLKKNNRYCVCSREAKLSWIDTTEIEGDWFPRFLVEEMVSFSCASVEIFGIFFKGPKYAEVKNGDGMKIRVTDRF